MVSRPILHDIVAAVFDPRPESRSGLESRFSYLKTMGFPPMPSVGSGRSLIYGVNEVFATCLLFRLQQAFIGPVAASRIVIETWPEVMAGLAAARERRNDGPPVVMRLDPRGLTSIGQGATDWDTQAIALVVGAFNDPRMTDGTPRVSITIDVSRLIADIAEALGERGRVADERFFHDLTSSIVADDGEGIELSRRDWYFRRATRFLARHDFRSDEAAPEVVLGALSDPDLAYLHEPMPREIEKRAERVGEFGFQGALSALLDVACCRAGIPPPNPVAALRSMATLGDPLVGDTTWKDLTAHAHRREGEINGPSALGAPPVRRRRPVR